MDNNKINKILQDLYEIDPGLKKQEQELRKIIKRLLISKPEVKIDQKFVKDLRERLVQGQDKKVSFKINYMNKFIYAGIGMAVMALVLIPYYTNKDGVEGQKFAKNTGVQIESVQEGAFGDLNNLGSAGPESDNSSDTSAGIMGMGSSESASSGDSVSSRIMPMPPRVSYQYEYVGDNFEIENNNTSVIQRSSKEEIVANQLLSLDKLNIGDIDYDNFNNLKFNNISLYEDSDNGYMITINSKEEKVAIYKNWRTWPQEDGLNKKLEISDVPSDEVIISTANQFIDNYGIDLSPYGEPIVDKGWLKNYERSENKDSVYIPQTMTVIYPLILEGKEVYTQHSDKYGLKVQVDIRNNKVNSVNEIVTHNYESSNYEAVEEVNEIIEVAERGGYKNYSYNREGDNIEKVTVELDTPSLELVRLWKHNPSEDKSQELYVEAYVFPVINSEDNLYYQDYLIVPLVKELLEEDKNNSSAPEIGIPESPQVEMPSIQTREENPGSRSKEMEIQIIE